MSELTNVQVDILEPDGREDRTITQIHPDVVLIDIDQSRGRGLEIIRQTCRGRGKHLPVVMAIASTASLQYRASCIDAGALYFFDRIREQDWLVDSLASIREQLA
jgi:chemotaxis response regulator CheB